jgi:hypothetical protein
MVSLIFLNVERLYDVPLPVVHDFVPPRVQNRNKAECISKLQTIIAECWLEPKEREMYEGIGEKTKLIRKDEKRKRSAVKESRRQRSFDDD